MKENKKVKILLIIKISCLILLGLGNIVQGIYIRDLKNVCVGNLLLILVFTEIQYLIRIKTLEKINLDMKQHNEALKLILEFEMSHNLLNLNVITNYMQDRRIYNIFLDDYIINYKGRKDNTFSGRTEKYEVFKLLDKEKN